MEQSYEKNQGPVTRGRLYALQINLPFQKLRV
jgi:hypothetical protein